MFTDDVSVVSALAPDPWPLALVEVESLHSANLVDATAVSADPQDDVRAKTPVAAEPQAPPTDRSRRTVTADAAPAQDAPQQRDVRPPVARPASSFSERDTPSLTGWSSFEMKKTVAELAEAKNQEPPRQAVPIVTPRSSDVFPLSVGVSHLAAADWGVLTGGIGQMFGRQIDVAAFLTAGPLGLLPRSGHATVDDPANDTRIEGGEVTSELRGSSLGGRFTWRTTRSRPAISVYLHEEGSRTPTLLAFSQYFKVNSKIQFGGEIASNGSGFARAHFGNAQLDLSGYFRYRPEFEDRDFGLSGGVGVGRGVLLSGGTRVTRSAAESSVWNMASLRVPFGSGRAVTFEQSLTSGDNSRTISAVMLQIPYRRLQFLQRLQFGHDDVIQRGVPIGFDTRQSQTSTHFTPGPWGHVSYQQSLQWFDSDHAQPWDELSTTLRLGHKTAVEAATAFPDVLNPQRLRARVTRQLSPRTSFEVQYGMLSAFQLTRFSTEDERPTFMVTVTKVWDVHTPARGGVVSGRVVDQAQRPVPEVPVMLGDYRTVTDDNGRYQFSRVPAGRLDVSLDKERLPVSYATEDAPHTVVLSAHSSEVVNFELMPLNTIRGRVYVDRNRNNAFDSGEGVAGIPITIGSWVTATDDTGAFAFYNQPPGTYVVKLDVAHMPTTLAPASDTELDVELLPERPLTGLEFKVQPKQRAVIMQTLP